jgi:hypothetical protein
MINELLEIRQMLFETAELLYGPEWLIDNKFWGSPTELQLMDNTFELENLGYSFPEPSEEEVEKAKNIAKDLGLGFDF